MQVFEEDYRPNIFIRLKDYLVYLAIYKIPYWLMYIWRIFI